MLFSGWGYLSLAQQNNLKISPMRGMRYAVGEYKCEWGWGWACLFWAPDLWWDGTWFLVKFLAFAFAPINGSFHLPNSHSWLHSHSDLWKHHTMFTWWLFLSNFCNICIQHTWNLSLSRTISINAFCHHGYTAGHLVGFSGGFQGVLHNSVTLSGLPWQDTLWNLRIGY